MSLPPGLLDEKYEVLGKLGEGGMGTVYQVRHVLLDDLRVAKVVRQQPGEDPRLVERFHQEARTAIRLRHPGLAQLYDFSVAPDGTAVIVMEFIDGVTVLHLLRTHGPPEIGLTIEIALQGLAALAYLHEMGYVHRDVSPDNLMLTRGRGARPEVKLIDLGLAKNLDSSLKLTQTGTYLGKVRYSAPEQFGDAGVDERSDVYSFGVLLYELLTGILPISGEQFSELVGGHLVRPPRAFDETDPEGRVPRDLRAVVLRTLEKDPALRVPSALEMARLLEPFRLPYQSPFAAETEIVTPEGGEPAPAPLGTKAIGEAGPTVVTVRTGLPRAPGSEGFRRRGRAMVLAAVVAAITIVAAIILLVGRPSPGEEAFRQGVRQLNQENWSRAAKHFRDAIEATAQEDSELIEIEPGQSVAYLPHYYLGRALCENRDYFGAWQAWEASKRQGVVEEIEARHDDLMERRRAMVDPAIRRAEKLLSNAGDHAVNIRPVLDDDELAWLRHDAPDLAEEATSLLGRLERARRNFEAARPRRDFIEINEVETEIRDVNEQLRELGDQILDRLSRAEPE